MRKQKSSKQKNVEFAIQHSLLNYFKNDYSCFSELKSQINENLRCLPTGRDWSMMQRLESNEKIHTKYIVFTPSPNVRN